MADWEEEITDITFDKNLLGYQSSRILSPVSKYPREWQWNFFTNIRKSGVLLPKCQTEKNQMKTNMSLKTQRKCCFYILNK